eukprot:359931-Chlamydomonas_euryale.AAC.4
MANVWFPRVHTLMQEQLTRPPWQYSSPTPHAAVLTCPGVEAAAMCAAGVPPRDRGLTSASTTSSTSSSLGLGITTAQQSAQGRSRNGCSSGSGSRARNGCSSSMGPAVCFATRWHAVLAAMALLLAAASGALASTERSLHQLPTDLPPEYYCNNTAPGVQECSLCNNLNACNNVSKARRRLQTSAAAKPLALCMNTNDNKDVRPYSCMQPAVCTSG